jgi:flagellar motor switch/type III secretory pathway protein FliN
MADMTLTAPQTSLEGSADDPWKQVMALPCRLRVEVPVAVFTVADLLGLGPGSVVRSGQREGSPAFVQINGQVIGRGEFDVLDDALAIRLTQIA